MIFLVIFVLGAIFYAFISFWGLLLGGIAFLVIRKKQRRQIRELALQEPPSHVTLLTPPKPYDWESATSGWDGAEELDVDEEI